MSKRGPIIIVEDDPDDQHMFQSIFETLNYPNNIRIFEDGIAALDYLLITKEQPFLILCDVNLPKMNGLELRARICENEYLHRKSIPFVFLSTSDNEDVVISAYNLTVQGFFVKRDNYQDMVNDLRMIYVYWATCKHPNTR